MTAPNPEFATAKAAPAEITAPDTDAEVIFPAHTATVVIEFTAQVSPPQNIRRAPNQTALTVEKKDGVQLVSSID